MKSFWINLTIAGFLLTVTWPATASDADTTVRDLQQGIVAILKDDQSDQYEFRFKSFLALVEQTHDMQTISRLTIGRSWRDLDLDSQDALVDAITRVSAATYASRFKTYNNQHFSISETTPQSRGRQLVNATLETIDGQTIQFDYLLKPEDTGWKIINIIVDGVSDLALKRAEYNEYLTEDGVAGLMAHLQQQLEEAQQ